MAMSVAIGMAQPEEPSPLGLTARNSAAGTTIPPMAAMTGSAARRGSRSSPSTSSRLISKPTTKKKTVINPSLIQPRRSRVELAVAEADRQLGVPQVDVRLLPRRVGPDEGDHGGDDQGHATGGFGVQEVSQRAEYDRSGPHALGHGDPF